MLIECLSVFVVVVGPNWTIALHNTRCPRDRFNMYAEFRMYHFQLGPIKENVSVSECAGVWLVCACCVVFRGIQNGKVHFKQHEWQWLHSRKLFG